MTHNRNAIGTLEAADHAHRPSAPVNPVFEEPRRTIVSLPASDDLLHVARLVTMGELSACFAHDVFNPLMLIHGHLRFVDEGLPEDHPLRVNFEVIEKASKRIEDMARRMLDFSRKRDTHAESYDVAELVADALRFMQPYFQAQYTEVKINIATGLPRIEVDRSQMIQALVNLLQNAADSMSGCDQRNMSVVVSQTENDIRIAVADSGPGINSDDLPRIFTPFFTTKGERGTGLGLYITRRIVEEHRGEITVQTGPRGTTFMVSLPIHH